MKTLSFKTLLAAASTAAVIVASAAPAMAATSNGVERARLFRPELQQAARESGTTQQASLQRVYLTHCNFQNAQDDPYCSNYAPDDE